MSLVPRVRRFVPSLVLSCVLGAVLAAPAAAAPSCDRVASPSGSDSAAGTTTAPYRSAQRLLDALSAGQTGCLRTGTYTQPQLRFNHAGNPGAPITLTSYPGERGKLTGGIVYVPAGADHVTLSNLDIDTHASTQVGIQIMATDVTLERSDITNRQIKSCIILGSNSGWGQAARITIRENRIHDCGNPANGNQDHGIYVENSLDTTITDNLFWGTSAFAVHLYPNARRTAVTHNVIDANGRGIIIAGDTTHASQDNRIEHNLITNSTTEYNLQAYWAGPIGTGNTATNNCIYNGKQGNIATQTGFSATNNTTANPGYTNPTNHDYRLPTTSPCLPTIGYDTATKLTEPTVTPAPVPAPAPAPAADTMAPALKWTAPVAGATVSGQLSEAAGNCVVAASDGSGIARVELYLDGALLNIETAAPYACVLDTGTVANGTHSLKALAYDTAGNAAAATIAVTVRNVKPPVVRLLAPLDGSVFGRSVAFAASASDDRGVTKVTFSVDGKPVATDVSAPYAASWAAPSRTSYAWHSFTARAYDADGLSAAATTWALRR